MQRHRRWQRHREAELAALRLERRGRAQRTGQRLAPRLEPRRRSRIGRAVADGQRGRDGRTLGHTDAGIAYEVVELGRHRQLRALGQPCRHIERDEQRIGLLIDMVHQSGDDERARHRIGRIARLHAPRQRPCGVEREAAVARRLPIAVPARLGAHADRQRGVRAGGGRQALRHQHGRNMRTVAARHLLGAGRRGEAEQQGAQERHCHQHETHRRHRRLDPTHAACFE